MSVLNVLKRCLAAGMPVVASEIGQLRPLLGGGRSQLVAAGNPHALARGWRRRAEQIVAAA
jgi:hypothetical protein